MKKIIAGVVGALAVAVAGFVAFVALQPSELKVARSLTMASTPADVYPLVSDLHHFTTWDPWSKMDPEQTMTYGEPSSGVGAWYSWKGDETGAGKMTVISESPPNEVVMQLEFIEPFASTASATTTVTPAGDGVTVSWAFATENGFMSKLFGVFVDMDAMLGADFDKGLQSLKPLAEAATQARLATEAEAAAEAMAAEAASR